MVVLGLVVAGTFGLLKAGSGTTTDESGEAFLQFGDLAIPIVGTEPLAGRPPVFQGRMAHPEPQFDVSPLGADLTFATGDPDRSALDEMDDEQDLFGWFGRAVYLGEDVQGDPVYLFQQTGPSLIDLIRGVFTDLEVTGIFGSSYSCCRSQSAEGNPPVNNQPFVGTVLGGDRTFVTAEMWAVDPEVAVVAFLDADEQPIGWQRPVSSYVGVRLKATTSAEAESNIHMIAYNAIGQEIQTASWKPEPVDETFGD